jgi:16S rRNA G966 N2-methylase RsmD
MNTGSTGPVHDRQLLLEGAKRNTVLDLMEVQRYGIESWGDPDYVCIYGLRPTDWYGRGIRILGRTAVECTRDELANNIGRDIATVAKSVPLTSGALVIDPFTGSGNTLYWMLRHLPGARGFGFEQDRRVFQLTSRNLATLNLSIEVANRDYSAGLSSLTIAPDQLLIAFIAPPWGDALNKSTGLDLCRTTPPITEIVDFLIGIAGKNPLLCAIQVFETLDAASLAELTPRFSWSARRMYGLNAPGQNHGLLMGTRGWVPRADSR